MNIRLVEAADHSYIVTVINEWWGGREMAAMLPKLFFVHFRNTSYIAEIDGEIIGFLIGFLSPTHQEEAYIHFVGIHPNYRGRSIGSKLYERFFQTIKQEGRSVVRCITSPVNKASIAYHTKLGFEIEKGNKEVDGVSVFADYDGPNVDRVLFVKRLEL